MSRIRSILLLAGICCAPGLRAQDGSAVVALYNTKVPASKELAEYYAQKRNVPAEQVIGLPLPDKEAITRDEYRNELLGPFLEKLESLKLLSFHNRIVTNAGKEETFKLPDQSKFRYAVLFHGVPLKIEADGRIKEPGSETARPENLRNEAAVDNELATLPLHYANFALSGTILNRGFMATNRALLHPTNGLLMVTRIDGPTPEIARGLIDKALQAEKDGLWGRAYFDTRGLTNGGYKVGDDMIRACARSAARFGFEKIEDDHPTVFPAGFPMPQIGIYVGWYEFNVTGAFARPQMEFMPGAFAYHLHSFSAQTIRDPNARWVGPLLARGATCTMGATEEPYLEGTPDIAVFLGRWLFLGFSFGEAAYASQRMLSWQTTVVGDPLYRPFARKPQDVHEELERAKSKYLEWSFLRIVNINLATELPKEQAIAFLREIPLTKTSALLSEKLGELLKSSGKWIEAMDSFERALTLNPTPQQRLRIALAVTPMQTNLGRGRQAYEIYKEILRDFPDYPDKLKILQEILPLADQFGKPGESTEYDKQIKALTPNPPPK